jgi:hypothetical protein
MTIASTGRRKNRRGDGPESYTNVFMKRVK